jgi:predicted O-linked N-acetylglucosamine transferase (SPINDLY family)
MFDGLRLALIRRLEKLTGQDSPTPTAVHDPNLAETLRKQGNALIAEGNNESAEKCFREALKLQGDDPKLLVCLGYVLKEQARFAEARVALRRAISLGGLDPESYEAHYLLAEISELQSDPEDAKRQLAAALALKPDFTRACADLVRLMRQTGQESEVKDLLAHSVHSSPDCMEYRLWLAEVCADSLDYQETVEHLAAVIRLGGGNVRIYLTIGAALCRIDRFDEATEYFEQALTMDPSVAYEVCYHQGYFQSRIGNSTEAIALFEKSIELQPDYLASHHMLLFNLCFAEPQVPGRYKEAAQRFNQVVRPKASAPEPHKSQSLVGTKRPLRVGFSCGEFRNHPVYYFLIGFLERIDHSKFELIAYSNNEIDDQATAVLKGKVDDWHDIHGLPDDAAADLIRSHQIDILIDLCGHSGENRLPVFARRPAPVQAAWLGYFASTGLAEMDFIIADPGSVPEDSTEWFSETVVRLPATRLCMEKPKPSRDIPVAPPPCVHRGYITFGSFQQAAKITPRVMQAWSKVLAAVPTSRLRIQSSAFGSEAVRKRVADGMQAAGIDLKRIDMMGGRLPGGAQ